LHAGRQINILAIVPGSDAAASIDVETAARLRAVVGKLSRRLNALARGSGLTPSQLSALGVIARQGPMRLSELAEAESMNPTMLSRVVAALDDAGLVRRRADPGDRRAGLLEVTASGRRTHDRLRAERGRALTSGLQTLDPHSAEAIAAALPALEALVEAVGRRDGSAR
jgi:DNA-binding MarR family transcriptional regulator